MPFPVRKFTRFAFREWSITLPMSESSTNITNIPEIIHIMLLAVAYAVYKESKRDMINHRNIREISMNYRSLD